MLHQIVETIVLEGMSFILQTIFLKLKLQEYYQQIFTNLISNAIKYNDKPIGKIECLYESLTVFTSLAK
jgi:signal transduction histidine kinase